MKVLSIAAALVAIVIVAAALGVSEWRRAKPLPLSGFVAPFVFGRFHLPADNPLTQEAFELGRRLFYDPRLSIDNTVSCSTCHKQRLAFTDGRKTGVGVSGKPLAFNSMSLANLMWGPRHFFWNGRAATLEHPRTTTCQVKINATTNKSTSRLYRTTTTTTQSSRSKST